MGKYTKTVNGVTIYLSNFSYYCRIITFNKKSKNGRQNHIHNDKTIGI